MELIKKLLPDVNLISIKYQKDIRGEFKKNYNFDDFNKLGINFLPKESYISKSSLNVLRGMHYQIGNYAQKKLVSCISGKILDVIVDIRPNSTNYNKPISYVLDEEKPEVIMIGKGYAHGFLSLSKNSIMSYLTSTVYAPKFDCGILWSSIDFEWPLTKPILSERDKLHPLIGKHKCEFS